MHQVTEWRGEGSLGLETAPGSSDARAQPNGFYARQHLLNGWHHKPEE